MSLGSDRLSSLWRYGAAVAAVAAVAAAPGAALADGSIPATWNDDSISLTTTSQFYGVEAVGPRGAWAVGRTGEGATTESLVARWNGTAWATVASPSSVPLTDVEAASASDVWAVGAEPDGSASAVQHWDGTAWTLVPHVAGTTDNPVALDGVTIVDPENVIAVGFQGGLQRARPHAQHWDGVSWQEKAVPGPDGALLALLVAVDHASVNSVWASGFALSGEGALVPYFARWDGTGWSAVDVPDTIVGGYSDILVLGPERFVAVGATMSMTTGNPVPVAVTYNSGVWRQETLPVAAGELTGISADGSGGYWVCGNVGVPHVDAKPLVMRHKVTGWSVFALPDTGVGGLLGVTHVPGRNEAWAVGQSELTNESQRNLILGYHSW